MCEAALLRWQFQLAHQFLDAQFESIFDNRATPYARVTVCEDIIINGILAGGKPLALSSWRGQTGLSELPPLPNAGGRCAWDRRVRIDAQPFRAYVCAVHTATDTYLAELGVRQRGKTHIRLLVALLLRLSTARAETATLEGA